MKAQIVMRSCNDMPIIQETLEMIDRQSIPYDLFVFDNESTDGTLDTIRDFTDNIITVKKGTYVPGQVLNQGMSATSDDFVVFNNSDCTPLNNDWLKNMLAGFKSDRIAAVFGRQEPRKDCSPLFARDTRETFGDGSRQKYWRHCFSMATSAIRRDLWEKMPFNEQLQYSEDIHWTWQARKKGFEIKYVPDSAVYHSHNYSLKQFFKRHFGEGKAEAQIFEWEPWQRSLVRYSILPYLRQVYDDWRFSIEHLKPGSLLFSPVLRMAQLIGRRHGFIEGLKQITTEIHEKNT